MTKLSLCMIVKDEEQALGKCLESVQGIVDEMIVMDTGSQDKTCEIAQAYGAKVEHFAWTGNFSEARNAALECVTGDWILVLDADEVFNHKIVPVLERAMSNDQHLVINFLRQEVGARQSPYSLVSRLFRNHPKIKFSRPYHTLIDDQVNILLKSEPHWRIVEVPEIGIFHYGYKPELIESLDKANRAQKAMESYFKEHPHDAYVCNKLGALYIEIGRDVEGIKLLKQGLKSGKVDEHTAFELHYHLANAYRNQGKMESAIKHYNKALNKPINKRVKIGAYNNLAGLMQFLGQHQQALELYETVVEIDPSFALGHFNRGVAWKDLGNFAQAQKAYEKALALEPEYAQAQQNLGAILLRRGDAQGCIDAFKRAIMLHEKQNRPQEAKKLRQGLTEISLYFPL